MAYKDMDSKIICLYGIGKVAMSVHIITSFSAIIRDFFSIAINILWNRTKPLSAISFVFVLLKEVFTFIHFP